MAEGITTTTGGPSKKRWNKKNNGNEEATQHLVQGVDNYNADDDFDYEAYLVPSI